MSSTNNDNPDAVGKADIGNQQHPLTDASDDILQSWRTRMGISSARTRKIRGSNYVQLATVDPDTGEPRCRTVVFRGFLRLPPDHMLCRECDGEPCVMRMITDLRSRKVQEIERHPSDAAELLWWFPKTTEQYRVSGRLVFVGAGRFRYDGDEVVASARREMWGNLSDSAREQFLDSENVPGEPYTGEPTGIPAGGRDGRGSLLPPPDSFLLMLLVPEHVDYLRLQNMYRQIDRYSKDGGWESERVNP